MRWKQKPFDPDKRDALEADGILPLFATILANREAPIFKKADIADFVECPLANLPDPESIAGIADASVLLGTGDHNHAVIFGDYDVDGVSSSYMMRRVLKQLGVAKVDIFLPERMKDGYGLNDQSVRRFLSLTKGMGVDLVLALDCGSSSRSQISAIKKDIPDANVIVVDHHIVSENEFSDNAEAVVNPRISGSDPFCTGGLVYMLARNMAMDDGLLPYAALATVADVCELQGANRILVKQGLEAFKHCRDVGIMELFNVSEVDPAKCASEDIGFKIAPMINAAGRIGLATTALKALESPNRDVAVEVADKLRGLNDTRKRIQGEIVSQVEQNLSKIRGKASILAQDDSWHIGIVGIVAGKLAEAHRCPVLCFGRTEKGITGSARSQGGVHIKEVLDDCSEMFERYGGHEQAAGATLKPEYLDNAAEIFDRAVIRHMQARGLKAAPVLYDAELDSRFAQMLANKAKISSICDRIEALGPFGNCNERPVLRANGLKCKAVYPWKSNKGGFIKFERIALDCYANVPDLKEKIEGKRVDVLFKFEKSFKDEGGWAIRVERARIADVS